MDKVVNIGDFRSKTLKVPNAPLDTNLIDVRVGVRAWDIENADTIQKLRGLTSKAAALSQALALCRWMDDQRHKGSDIYIKDPDGTFSLLAFPDDKS